MTHDQIASAVPTKAAPSPGARMARGEASPTTRGGRGVVLYAGPYDLQPRHALLRADALAGAYGARLVVLRTVPAITAGDPMFPQRSPQVALRLLRLEHAAGRLTARWCGRVLRSPPSPSDIHLRRGSFIDAAIAQAEQDDVRLIVIPKVEGVSGRMVEELANETDCPVLVARVPTRSALVVGASSLEDLRYPVLRFVHDLGTRLRAPTLYVHNVAPHIIPGEGPPLGAPGGIVDPDPRTLEERQRRLLQLAMAIDTSADVEVRHRLDPANAVLAAARDRAADLVVVGSQRRSWLRRLTHGSVAARVVDQARRSVLVVPLTPGWPARLPMADA